MQIDSIAGISLLTQTRPVAARNQTIAAETGGNTERAVSPAVSEGGINTTVPSVGAPDAEEAIRSLEEAVKPANIALNFSRDEETGTIVIKLIDQASGELVQQIPAEALLHLSAILGKLQGQLFNREA